MLGFTWPLTFRIIRPDSFSLFGLSGIRPDSEIHYPVHPYPEPYSWPVLLGFALGFGRRGTCHPVCGSSGVSLLAHIWAASRMTFRISSSEYNVWMRVYCLSLVSRASIAPVPVWKFRTDPFFLFISPNEVTILARLSVKFSCYSVLGPSAWWNLAWYTFCLSSMSWNLTRTRFLFLSLRHAVMPPWISAFSFSLMTFWAISLVWAEVSP